ncbi:MAG TPA: YbhN family protein [Trebonia sp.]|nr:YbhN family protein [Trebonia sp.]
MSKVLGSRAVKYGFVVLTLALGAYAVSTRWTDIHHDLGLIGLRWSALALLAVLAALFTSMLSWRALLVGLGSPLPVTTSARIFFIGQLGKYLPGAVWPILAQMEIAAAHKVPRTRTGLASVLTMLIALLSGLIIAVVALPFTGGGNQYAWVFLAAPVLVACLYPKILNWGFGRLLKLARRTPLDQPLGGRAIVISLGWSFLSWLCYGLQIWVLAVRVGAPTGTGLPLAIGTFAFAWCAGFLVIFAPAGGAIREVVIVAMLGPTLGGNGKALAVALVSRAVTAAADVITAGAATIAHRRDKKKAAAIAPDAEAITGEDTSGAAPNAATAR